MADTSSETLATQVPELATTVASEAAAAEAASLPSAADQVALPPCCDPLDGGATWADSLPPGYAQLLGLGMVMILGHCAGMCGPLIMSFRFGLHQATKAGRMRAAVGQIACYQGGRGLMYGLAGALVGGIGGILGSDVSAGVFGGMKLVAPLVALGFIAAATWQWLGPRLRRARPPTGRDLQPGPLSRLGMAWRRRFSDRPYRYALGLGLLMSLLPCMLTAWVLGLALVSASVWHGLALMVLLVVMTTPALLPFAVLPTGFLGGKFLRHPAVGITLWYCSGIWMGLIALAANGVIDHVSITWGSWRVVLW